MTPIINTAHIRDPTVIDREVHGWSANDWVGGRVGNVIFVFVALEMSELVVIEPSIFVIHLNLC